MLTWLCCKAKKKYRTSLVILSLARVSYTDIDFFHIQLSIDKYWICETYVCVCMTEVKKGTVLLRSHINVYIFVLCICICIFVMKVLLFLNHVLRNVQ